MHVAIAAYLGISLLCALWVAYDTATGQPAIIPIMKVAWVLITLYLGVVGLILYLTSCREPAPGTHSQFVAPMWKQAVGSTVHCIAGDGIGIVIVAGVVSVTTLRWYEEFSLEYLAAFVSGWLLFQAVAMGRMMGGFRAALRGAFVAIEEGKVSDYSQACFESYWCDDKDISQEDVLREIVAKVGMDADNFFTQIGDDRIKRKLFETTDEIIERGGFGSPTFFLDKTDMYFGNDRIELMQAAVDRNRAA